MAITTTAPQAHATVVVWLALVAFHAHAAPPLVVVEPAAVTEQMRRQADGPKQRILLDSADLRKRPAKSNNAAETAAAPRKPVTPPDAGGPTSAPPHRAAAQIKPPAQDEASEAAPAVHTQSGPAPQTPASEAQRAASVARRDSALPVPAPALPGPEEPQLMQRVLPAASEIPERAGTVTVGFVILEDGSVTDVAATESTDRRLSRIAVGAVRQWRYSPLPARRAHAVKLRFQGSED